MSTDKKISTLVEQQFPQFARDDGPNFVAFVKAYYEWTEQANNVIEVSKNLREYQDIDTTYDKYLEYFHREVLGSIPRATLTDRKKLAKHIKDMYRARGSELSYRLLFRLLYNEEIEFYYPGEDILRASDGRWVKENTIRLGVPRVGLVTQFANENITGLTSGATAKVDRIVGGISGGAIVDELYLLNIVGTFQDNERVALVSNNDVYATIFAGAGPLQSIQITQSGAFHQKDDIVTLTSASGTGAIGGVTATNDTSSVQWSLDDGGSGYTANATITITDNGGFGTSFAITGISNTEVIALNTDTIEPFQNVVLNTGPTFVSAGANTSSVSANLATANSSSVLSSVLSFANNTVGTISSITTTNYGYGYATLPTALVIQQNILNANIPDGSGGIKGANARISADHAPGAITSVNVSTFGTNYSKFDEVTVTNSTRSGTQDAKGNPVTSGIINYPGKYTDTKGWLSWNNRLQDNFYYQEYSYEIRSNQFTNTYRKLVNEIVHPAGTKMFGRIRLFSDVEPSVVTIDTDDTRTLKVISEIEIDIPTAVSDSVDSYIDTAANTTPTIERLSLVEPTLGDIETNVFTFSPGTGNLFIYNDPTINTFASEAILTYANVAISVIGTPRLIVGNNTIFQVEIPDSNTVIRIIDNYGSTANGLYYTGNTFSNTAVSITIPYAGNTLSNGSFYIGTLV
jgi:hypothetical protein